MRILKFALIGCGRIAINHIKAALSNNLDIIAICDLIPERMEELLYKKSIDKDCIIKKYTDYKKMLMENDIDLVAIATESGSHAEIALYCIELGINVIIEKPMAMSLSDADLIIESAERNKVKVSVCHQNRFNIAVQETIKAIKENRFGKLSHGSINIRWNRSENYYKQAKWRGTWAQDGGALMNQCIHGIDLLRWLFGESISEVYGVTRQQFHKYLETEDLGVAVVKFSNGAIATIEGTTNVYPENLEETLYIFGEKGTVKLGGKSTNSIEIWDFKDFSVNDKRKRGYVEDTINVYGNGHISLYKDMIKSIVSNKKPYIDARDGKAALELVLAIYKSQKEGDIVKFPLANFSTLDMIGTFDK